MTTSTGGIPPFAWLASRSYSRIVRTMAAGGPDAEALERRYQNVRESMSELATFRHHLLKNIVSLEIARERGASALNDMDVAAEARLIQAIYHLLVGGRQVFEFDMDLIQELSRTDVDDVSPSDVQTPYTSFYLRMPGALPDVAGHPIDGILVQHKDYADAGRSLVLDFMPVHRSVEQTAAALRHMPTALLPLTGSKTLGGEIQERNWEITSLFPEGASLMNLNPTQDPAFENVVAEVTRRYREGEAYVRANLPIIVNVLLFIDNCRMEQKQGWSADAPIDLVAKAMAGGTGARKAEQKLVQTGWGKVILCQVERNARPDSAAGDRTVKAHWRRGHWRRQPYGPGLSLIKLIRVRPTMVGTGNLQEGRVYQGRLKKTI